MQCLRQKAMEMFHAMPSTVHFRSLPFPLLSALPSALPSAPCSSLFSMLFPLLSALPSALCPSLCSLLFPLLDMHSLLLKRGAVGAECW